MSIDKAILDRSCHMNDNWDTKILMQGTLGNSQNRQESSAFVPTAIIPFAKDNASIRVMGSTSQIAVQT